MSRLQQSISIDKPSETERTFRVKAQGLGDAWAALMTLEKADEALLWISQELKTIAGPLLLSNEVPQMSSCEADTGAEGSMTMHISWSLSASNLTKEAAIIRFLDFVQGMPQRSSYSIPNTQSNIEVLDVAQEKPKPYFPYHQGMLWYIACESRHLIHASCWQVVSKLSGPACLVSSWHYLWPLKSPA